MPLGQEIKLPRHPWWKFWRCRFADEQLLPRLFPRLHYTHWKIAFLPRAVWIGMAWKRYPCALDLMFCPLPCLAIGLYIQWHYKEKPR